MEALFGMMAGLADGGREMTVVFDKGMNTEENIAFIDGQRQYLGQNTILHVYNVHLGTAYMERRNQARRLLDSKLLKNRDLKR